MSFCEEQAFEKGCICSVKLIAKGFDYLDNPFSTLMHFILTVFSFSCTKWAEVYEIHPWATVCQNEQPSLK